MRYFLLLSFFLFNSGAASPESVARRIQAHLLVGDPSSALKEAKVALGSFPQEPLVYVSVIKSLAAMGEDAEMMHVWEKYHTLFKEQALDHDLLEEMCWGILKKGQKSGSTNSQLICLIGSALTQDIRAVPVLLEGMRHTNSHMRALSVELSAHYGDHVLCEEIRRLFREENVQEVRLSVIQALGKLRQEALLPELMHSIANPRTSPKETLAAIEAIVEMKEKIEKEELTILATSRRAGLRQLACEVIATCELEEASDLLPPLICDVQPEVCAAALKSWGLLRKPVTVEIKRLALEALDPTVGVTAAWVWLIDDPAEGGKAMKKWLEHDQRRVRALAASAVAASGPYGISLAKEVLEQSKDPYVHINLALALGKQREDIERVCTLLEQLLKNNHEKWMLSDNGLFNTLEKSNLSHMSAIKNYPEAVNQTTRLEILNLLAILESPGALEAIKVFLKEKKWGVTGLAAETLLGEGDETAIDLVKELLHDPDREVRLEAALVLASWGRDFSATSTLLEVYPKADRALKLKILESLGRIGDKTVIPFLIDRLKEPSLMLRMVGASILIQTLNS